MARKRTRRILARPIRSGPNAPTTAAILTLLTLILLPSATRAWGQNGHRVVGQIAESHLSAEAKRGVEALVGPDSLPRISTWADEIRSDRSWDEAIPWHYINIPPGGELETAERVSAGDVLAALERFEGVLRNEASSREEKAVALKFLVHFVGDVHQPLHTGYASDRGGNDVLVLWFDAPSNLHSVWDSELIEHQRLSYSELAAFIDHPTPEQVAAWQATGYREWIAESRAQLDQIYDLGNRRLSWHYAYRATPIVERRLLQAGVRLAGLLNRIFAQQTPSGAPTHNHESLGAGAPFSPSGGEKGDPFTGDSTPPAR